MHLCAQPLNHIKKDQLGDCWWVIQKSSNEWFVGHSLIYVLVKVAHPLKSYPMATATVLGFIL